VAERGRVARPRSCRRRRDSELWYDTRDISFLREDEKDAAAITSLKAVAMKTLVDAGYDPDTVSAAVEGGDLSLLRTRDQLPSACSCIRENGAKVRPLFQHGRDPQVGDKPLGPIQALVEDETGVYYEVPLLDTSYNREIVPGLREGLYGASFRFRVVKEDIVKRPSRSAYNPDRLPERTVTEAQVFEFGPVTFPAYDAATAGVRSLTDDFRREQIVINSLDGAPGVGQAIRDALAADAAVDHDRTADARLDRLYARSRAFVADHLWMCTLPTLAVIVGVLAERAAGVKLSEEELRDRIGIRDAVEQPAAPGVAVIPVPGPIVPHAGMVDDTSSELTSIENLQKQFRAALADPFVGAVLFNIDSPGGSADLVPEFAAEILAARGGDKPIWAVANTDAASAAYFIASQADRLLVTPSGYVGSIGVYTAHTDISAAMEKAGVKTTLISAGEFKVDGNPFEPLTDTAAAEMQTQVDAIYEVFVQAVADGRGTDTKTVNDTFGQGRMVMAAEAVKRGMADGVATLEQALTQLLDEIDPPNPDEALPAGAGASHSEQPSRPDNDALDPSGAGASHSQQPSREPSAAALPRAGHINKKGKPTWQL
jgi:signal peptide peptidase SppA